MKLKDLREHDLKSDSINEEDTTLYSIQFYYYGDDTLKVIDILSDKKSLTTNYFENSIKAVYFPSIVLPHSEFNVKFQIFPKGCSGDFYRRINFHILNKGYSQNFLIKADVIPTLSKNLKISNFFDLGLLKRGDTINYKILYKNIGTDTVELLPLGREYLQSNYSKLLLAPNETGFITIKNEETCKIDSLWKYINTFKTNITGNYIYRIETRVTFKKFNHLIKFEEDSFSYTFNSTEKTLRHEFIFKNISKKEIFINRVSTGDGGTIAQPETREAIKPGEKSKIIMEWILSNRYINYRTICIEYSTKEKNDCGCNHYPLILIPTIVKKDECNY